MYSAGIPIFLAPSVIKRRSRRTLTTELVELLDQGDFRVAPQSFHQSRRKRQRTRSLTDWENWLLR
jgi:hypothetical protein